jgi:hypothetical protein
MRSMRLAARPDSADCEVEVHVEAACAHLLCESAKGHGADRRAIGLISRRWEAAPIGTCSQFLWPEYPPTPDSQTKHYELTSWGPIPPFVIQAWESARILGQVMGGARLTVADSEQITAPDRSCARLNFPLVAQGSPADDSSILTLPPTRILRASCQTSPSPTLT